MMLQRSAWFLAGMMIGLTAISFSKASVPKNVTNDSALYEGLIEIPRSQRVSRKALADEVQKDQHRIVRAEGRFKERLPLLTDRRSRLQTPMNRIQKQKYRSSRAKLSLN